MSHSFYFFFENTTNTKEQLNIRHFFQNALCMHLLDVSSGGHRANAVRLRSQRLAAELSPSAFTSKIAQCKFKSGSLFSKTNYNF